MKVAAKFFPSLRGRPDCFSGIETLKAETLELRSCTFYVTGGKERIDCMTWQTVILRELKIAV